LFKVPIQSKSINSINNMAMNVIRLCTKSSAINFFKPFSCRSKIRYSECKSFLSAKRSMFDDFYILQIYIVCYVVMEPIAGTIGAALVATVYLYSGHLVTTSNHPQVHTCFMYIIDHLILKAQCFGMVKLTCLGHRSAIINMVRSVNCYLIN
jgi:hypothetical protein